MIKKQPPALTMLIVLFAVLLVDAKAYPSGHARYLNVPVSELVAFTPERSLETELSIRSNLHDDPHSPRIGSPHPALTLVCFTDYNCLDCKALDAKLHRLLELHPRLAVAYKFAPDISQSETASMMALTLWGKRPDKFDVFHLTLMQYKGILDDFAIQTALRAAGVTVNKYSQDGHQTLKLNHAFMYKFRISDIPSTLIGDRVMPGNVSIELLESAVKGALKEG